MLADIYNCQPTLAAVRSKIPSSTDKSACFQGVSCVLLDDGLRSEGQIPYNFHDEFLPNPSKRIVRIEALAEDIMQMQSDTTDAYGDNSEESFSMWYNSFQTAIVDALGDPQVVGFKTVMCYRGGLKWTKTAPFPPYQDQLIEEFEEYIETYRRTRSKRLEKRALVNALVQETCARIALSPRPKPLQIHTGFGDADIDLRKSNAA